MYLFLFGRDEKLSKLELFLYLKTNKIDHKLINLTKKYALLEINSKFNPQKIIETLASITKIYKVYLSQSLDKKIDYTFLDKLEIYDNKFNYSISGIDIDKNKLYNIIDLSKQYFKENKIKAVFKKPKSHSKKENNLIVNPENYFSYKLDKGFEIIIFIYNQKIYFANIQACFNPKTFKFLDRKRPLKRNLYSSSIRLSRIMINLLGLEKNKTILDPFCGTGTFLINSLLLGYNVFGIDKDSHMITVSKKNIEWLKQNFEIKNSYKLINHSSTKADFKAHGVVFEPYMGPFLDKRPSKSHAINIIKELEYLYSELFFNLNRNLSSNTRVVCILPIFLTSREEKLKISKTVFNKYFKIIDLNKFIQKDLDIKNPLEYDTPDGSKIKREIFILEKK